MLLPEPLCAGIAQLVEHLICNQRAGGSSPSAGASKIKYLSRMKTTERLLPVPHRYHGFFERDSRQAKVLPRKHCGRVKLRQAILGFDFLGHEDVGALIGRREIRARSASSQRRFRACAASKVNNG